MRRRASRVPPWPSGDRARWCFAASSILPSGREGRHHPLREEADLAGLQAEVAVLGEELPGLRVVGRAGHDEPADRAGAVAQFRAADVLGEELEERLVLDRADGEDPLGAVESPAACPGRRRPSTPPPCPAGSAGRRAGRRRRTGRPGPCPGLPGSTGPVPAFMSTCGGS